MTTFETRLGPIRGARARSATAFLGIPYAAPPLGAWPRHSPDSRACMVVEHTPRIVEDLDGPELRAAYGMG